MDEMTFRKIYWNYYHQLESDFFDCNPYCEIDTSNDCAYSIKYQQLLLTVCSEIDTICKTLCKKIDDSLDFDKCGISDYINILNSQYPTVADEKVVFCKIKYREILPWKSIAKKYPPNWWQAYNKVKHHRDDKENYRYANQKNTVEALAGLYVLIEYWASYNFASDKNDDKNFIMPQFRSSKFELPNWHFYFSFMGQSPWFSAKAFHDYIEKGVKE